MNGGGIIIITGRENNADTGTENASVTQAQAAVNAINGLGLSSNDPAAEFAALLADVLATL